MHPRCCHVCKLLSIFLFLLFGYGRCHYFYPGWLARSNGEVTVSLYCRISHHDNSQQTARARSAECVLYRFGSECHFCCVLVIFPNIRSQFGHCYKKIHILHCFLIYCKVAGNNFRKNFLNAFSIY